jgi:hypothetical protein
VQGALDSSKQLFEELLWEHRDLSEAYTSLEQAHNKCQGQSLTSGSFCTGLFLDNRYLQVFFVQLPFRKPRSRTLPAKSLPSRVNLACSFAFFV